MLLYKKGFKKDKNMNKRLITLGIVILCTCVVLKLVYSFKENKIYSNIEKEEVLKSHEDLALNIFLLCVGYIVFSVPESYISVCDI